MTDPKTAYERLLKSGPFDDPLIAHYPHRWHWTYDPIGDFSVLTCTPWRGVGTRYMAFTWPGPRPPVGVTPNL